MARVISWIYGELRGSISGNTFSRNASGAIVRSRVTPVNRNTVAQQRARQNFGAATQMYGALPDNDKTNWNLFASTKYIPLGKVVSMSTTGAQAYTGMAQMVNNWYSRTQFDIAPTTVGPTFTFADPVINNTPPDDALTSVIVNGATTGVPVMGGVVTELTLAGDFTVTVEVPGNFHDGTVRDLYGNQFGFIFYLSNKVPFSGAATKTQFSTVLGATQLLIDVDDVGSETIPWSLQITGTTDLVTPDFKYGFQVGDWYLLTACMYSASGMLIPYDSEYIQITA